VVCSKDENQELFRCIPWSHGTLGFVVAAEIKIIRCRPFVHLTYLPFQDRETAFEKFEKESREANYDFVECLAYSSSEYVLMLGNMTDNQALAEYNPIGRWYKEWFFIHVKNILKQGYERQEILPLRDYYHRHTKSLFWEMQDIVPFGNNLVFRWLFGWTMPPKPSLMKLTQTEALRRLYELHHVVQDMLVPMNHLSNCLDVFHKEINVYPLWICPFKLPAKVLGTTDRLSPSEMGIVHTRSSEDELFVDVGAYGNPTVRYQASETLRRLEHFVRQVNGYQMMYADSYMTR
jgi:delta24-sterol reductase